MPTRVWYEIEVKRCNETSEKWLTCEPVILRFRQDTFGNVAFEEIGPTEKPDVSEPIRVGQVWMLDEEGPTSDLYEVTGFGNDSVGGHILYRRCDGKGVEMAIQPETLRRNFRRLPFRREAPK
jgi:hypothetical protein